MEEAALLDNIGLKCVKWYEFIVSRDIERAIEMKLEIDRLMESSSKADRINNYYELVNYRHDLLMEDVQKRLSVKENEIEMTQSDVMLKYMYYFFTGQNEFYKGRYKSAIRFYNLASKLLENLDKIVEKAEFYQRVGAAYYRLNQYAVAMNYMEQSKELFLELDGKNEKVLNCDLIIGCIYSEVHDFDKADKVFKTAISQADNYPYTRGLLLRSHGLNLLRQDKLEEAEKKFMEALNIKEHESSYVSFKTKADLANIKLRLGKTEQGVRLLEEAENLTNKNRNVEFRSRNMITRHLYVELDEKEIDKAILMLQEQEYYFEGYEMAQEISEYYEKKGNLEQCIKYLKVSHQMNIKQNQLGEWL